MAAAEQRVGGQRLDPVGELEAGDPAAGPGDLLGQLGVPPHVVGVHDDADGLAPGTAGQVDRVAEPGQHAPVRAEHRVQGLHAEPDAQSARPPGPARPLRRPPSAGPAPGPGCPAPARRRPGPARPPRARRPRPPPRGCRPARPPGRAGSAWVKNPPRHRLDTCSPAARTAAAAPARPSSATRSRHRPIAGISCRRHRPTACVQAEVLHRGLVERQPAQPASGPGHRGRRRGQVLPHPRHGQAGVQQRARAGPRVRRPG